MPDLFILSGLFIVGACIGSFLNVCIVRLPKEESVVRPRSQCLACHKQILWYDNIPLISYFLLKGRCRFCKKRFSFRYVLVELITAGGFVLFYFAFGLSLKLLAYLIMLCGFIVATFVDIEHRIIPDEISLGGLVAGLILGFLFPSLHKVDIRFLEYGRMIMWGLGAFCVVVHGIHYLMKKDREDAKFILMIIFFLVAEWLVGILAGFDNFLNKNFLSLEIGVVGFMIGGGMIYSMGLVGDFIFRKESMGGGDVKLMAMVGAFLGWEKTLLAFFIAPLFGAIVGIIIKIRTKESLIPYGPFLVIGALISLFWSQEILDLLFAQVYVY